MKISVSQATIVAEISHKVVAVLLICFKLYGPVTVSMYPKKTLNNLNLKPKKYGDFAK